MDVLRRDYDILDLYLIHSFLQLVLQLLESKKERKLEAEEDN